MSQSRWSSRAVVGVVAGAAIIAGGLLYAAYASDKSERKEGKQAVKAARDSASPAKAKKAQKAAAGAAAAPARKPITVAELPDAELFSRVRTSLEKIEAKQSISKSDKELYETCMSLIPSERSNQVRVVVAQWLLTHQTAELVRNVKTFRELKQKALEAVEETKYIWTLLDFVTGEPREAIAVDLLRIDVATRLKDAGKLSSTFDSLVSRGELGSHESIVVFSMAPLLGRWAEFVKISKKLMQDKPDLLAQFHQAAIENAATNDVADYSVLYDMAVGFNTRQLPPVPVDELFWGSYEIVAGRQTVDVATAADANTQAALDAEVAKGRANASTEMEALEAPRALEITGAIAHMCSLTPEVEIPMVGRATVNSIDLRGFADVKSEDEQQEIKVTETIALKRKPEENTVDDDGRELSTWVGTQTSTHTSEEGVLLQLQLTVEYQLRKI